jgi:UDP-glucose 4-epimerase
VLGRDARLQFVHVDDALEILHRSVVEDHPGTFNVAGAGVLLLSQAVRRAGRISVPLPESTLSTVAGLARGVGVGQIGLDQIDLFVHGRVVDTTRLVEEFDFTPRSTAAAFDDFIHSHQGGSSLTAERLAATERAILDGIRRVRAAAGDSAENTVDAAPLDAVTNRAATDRAATDRAATDRAATERAATGRAAAADAVAATQAIRGGRP